MAITTPLGNVADQAVSRGGFATSPEKYTTVEELLTGNAPDVKDQLAKIYGDQGITGFLKMTGAVRAGGSADFVEWYEEGRRHTKIVTGATTHHNATVQCLVGRAKHTKQQTRCERCNNTPQHNCAPRAIVQSREHSVVKPRTQNNSIVTGATRHNATVQY